MSEKEIIKNIMLGLNKITIDITKLVKNIGIKNYRKFEQALQEAYKLIENE
tara:strand:+ start:409 stop:561 length:153 start_codon:yes stop_codon:yes gene_type:complete